MTRTSFALRLPLVAFAALSAAALVAPAVALGDASYGRASSAYESPVFASAVPKAQSIGGKAGDSDPIVVGVSRDGKRVNRVVVRWSAPCGSGMRVRFAAPLTLGSGEHRLGGGRLSRSGSFEVTSAGTLDFGDFEGIVGQAGEGKLSTRRSTGVWAASVEVRQRSTGATVDICEVSFPWAAGSQQQMTYGGATNDGEPIVVRLDPRRTKVSVFHIGWHADCSDGGGFDLGDELVNFPLSRAGRFGDVFVQRFPREEGGEFRYSYVIRGKVGRTRASGTFKVTHTVHDASGATLVTCATPTVRWTANQ